MKTLRVPLPVGSNLNHYFEIMNSRGEQLEEHEILKAKLMKCFNSFESNKRDRYAACFDLIWEACSDMEKYIQYGFTTEQRHLVFGENNWNTLAVNSFDDFVNRICSTQSNDSNAIDLSIEEVINSETILIKPLEKEDSPDKFNSVINFQNFLLHVLRVQTAKDEGALDAKG